MDLKTMKQLAEREIFRYRDNCAYMQGMSDACCDHNQLSLHTRVLWVRAVDMAKKHWERTDAAKASFFSRYYCLDRPRKRYEQKPTICALSMQLHVAESTLYKWRNELLTAVVLAAIQIGALRPYDPPKEDAAANGKHR